MLRTRILLCVMLLTIFPARALERPEVTFKVFQFPPNMIPRIDGNDDDWAIVPDSYAIGMDQLVDTEAPPGTVTPRDPKKLDVKVKVGWVKGLNRLYFLYEANKDYWDFSAPGLHNDIFEVVVDGDLSGGPLIDEYHRDVWTQQAVGDMSKSIRASAARTPTLPNRAPTHRTTTFLPRRWTRIGPWIGDAPSTPKSCPTPTTP